jgi:glucokinase
VEEGARGVIGVPLALRQAQDAQGSAGKELEGYAPNTVGEQSTEESAGQQMIKTKTSRDRQWAAERTGTSILRYVMDHTSATRRTVSEDLKLSFPNVCRLVAGFQDSGIVTEHEMRQIGKRGPMSKTLSLRGDIGCTIGVDIEATQLRVVALNYANEVVAVLRKPVPADATPDELVALAAKMAGDMIGVARKKSLRCHAVGLGLPGPIVDESTGRVLTELQTGPSEVEFVAEAGRAAGLPTFCAGNVLCFAMGHHRFYHPRRRDTEMVVLNRFGIGVCVMRGDEVFSGELGLLPFGNSPNVTHYHDICTGASLLRRARASGDSRDLQAILSSPDDPLLTEWLDTAVAAFAQAIYSGVVMYSPDRVVIEGIFSMLPERVRAEIARMVTDRLASVGLSMPSIGLFEGDDLMGAKGAALMARDHVADDILIDLVRSARS